MDEAVKKLEKIYQVLDTIKLDGLINQARLVGAANEILNVIGLLKQPTAAAPAEPPAPKAGEEADA